MGMIQFVFALWTATALWGNVQAALEVEVDGARVVKELTTLRSFSDTAAPDVTRVLYTQADVDARKYLKELFAAEGLDVREDPIGNIFARWIGSDPEASAVGTGSHYDAIPLSGMYDGTVGVVAALEAFRALKRAGFQPKRSLEVLAFTSEEPTRFGLGCLGSRVMTGVLKLEQLLGLKDVNGTSFDEARRSAGYTADLVDLELDASYYDAFLELHIEQGPELEDKELDLGIVTAIAAPAQMEVTFEGDGGHAGAQLMNRRNDALLAASALALEVEDAALSTESWDTVATTGLLEILPNAVNSVPRKAKMGIDVRDIDAERRDGVLAEIKAAAKTIAMGRNVRYSLNVLNEDPPATSEARLIKALEEAADALGLSKQHMVSRAYHDSLFMARRFPNVMLFIPCRRGVSHRPDEFASEKAIADGVRTLALAMASLSENTPSATKEEL